MTQLSHFNSEGEAHMVDVGGKAVTQRLAMTEGYIRMQPETLQLIVESGHKKGDVLGIARIAGIMASKKTADLVPLCHPLPLTHVEINFVPDLEGNAVHCQTTVKTNGRTGVEMEALCATQVALLTIYDMCKAVDRGMEIGGVRLLEKKVASRGIGKDDGSTRTGRRNQVSVESSPQKYARLFDQ